MAIRPSRYRTLLVLGTIGLLIFSAGCRTPGPMADPAGDGGRSGLTPSPALSWSSRSTLQLGRLQLDFELEASTWVRILPPDPLAGPGMAPRPTEPY